MAPDDQPTAPVGQPPESPHPESRHPESRHPEGLHPETTLICAGRPGHAPGGPLNVPVVLASNFHAGPMAAASSHEDSRHEDSRAYSRTDATPAWEALETAVGQVEGGHAVAFSVLAFEVADAPTADRLCDAVRVIVHATSLGGVESTIERRGKLTGQEHVPPGLLRLSVGCEHVGDLWHDLDSALEQASRP